MIIVTWTVVAQTPAEQLSINMAQRMKDTLTLTNAQRAQLYDINMDLHAKKSIARVQAGTNNPGIQLQEIENTRDSLYRAVLTPEQYSLYRQKKNRLIHN